MNNCIYRQRSEHLADKFCVYLQIKLLGEGADDAGGVFDAIITEMCDELLNGSVKLLIPTPNHVNEMGFNTDRYLLNPHMNSEEDLYLFRFLGQFFFFV